MTFTGVALGAAGGEFLKLQNRKSTFPTVEEHVAAGRVKGADFDEAIQQTAGKFMVDRASEYYKTVSDRFSKVFSNSTDDFPNKDKANRPVDKTEEGPLLTSLSAVERTELIAKLERQADSKIMTERGLTQLITELESATENWKFDNLRETEHQFKDARKAYSEKYDALTKLKVEASNEEGKARR
jgi:hypothetical protein